MIPHFQTHGLGLVGNEELPKNDYYLTPKSQNPVPKSEEELSTKPVQPTITYVLTDKENKKIYTQDPVLNVLNDIDNNIITKVENKTSTNYFMTREIDFEDNDSDDYDEYCSD